MLSGSNLRKRLDRFFCHLNDFTLESIERVGMKPIPGITFEKEMKMKKKSAQAVKLPVLPSDHFGLLLKISPKVMI
jgi:tyrosyl-DNA phosphodiesterase 2